MLKSWKIDSAFNKNDLDWAHCTSMPTLDKMNANVLIKSSRKTGVVLITGLAE